MAAARAGEAGGLAVVDEFADWLAVGLANLVALLDPELVLIGGGLADVADLYLERTRTALAGEVFGGPVRDGTRLEVATLGSDAGAIGAALPLPWCRRRLAEQPVPGRQGPPGTLGAMEFRRINSLPPYVFTIIDSLKVEARRAGEDVIDLGFGNPDLPSPEIAVEKLSEAAHNTRNHRYSASRGIPKLRQAIADYYLRRFGVELDPDTEVINTIGAKEGFSHLMWTLLAAGRRRPGAVAVVPDPHLRADLRRGRHPGGAARHR